MSDALQRPMRRRVTTCLTLGLKVVAAAALALAVLVACLWPIGYRTAYVVFAGHVGMAVTTGRVGVVYNTEDLPLWPPGLLTFPLDPAEPPADAPHAWMGFGIGIDAGGEGQAHVPAPAALIALLATSVLAWRTSGRVRRRRLSGHCPRCGYDLRASPGRCPECGEFAVLQRADGPM